MASPSNDHAALAKIFKAYDVRATYPDLMNEDAAWKVGYASGWYFKLQVDAQREKETTSADTIVVSRDMRPHSPALAGALIDGLRASGMNVVDLGECDTSFIYFAVNHLGAAGGIQTTASHNPVQYNGFKLSGQLARPIGAASGLNAIREIAMTLPPAGSAKPKPGTKVQTQDLWDAYKKHVMSFYTPPAKGRTLKAFVDASNGMAGKMVPAIFDDAPGLELIKLNFEFGPEVPFAHDPNPLVSENMVPTQKGAVESKADLGACFDGDADRCIITDEKGQIIGCDHLTALLTGHFVAKYPGSTVLYDLRSSKVVERTIREHGAKPMKSRVGHVFMKAALRESQGSFGGELSGHFYFRDNFYADSGAIAFAAVLSVMGQSDKALSELVAPLKQYPQSGEMNFKVENKDGVLADLKDTYSDAAIDELDGVTIDAWEKKGWWFNVRASNTEPLLRLNAEARDQKTLEVLLAGLTPMLGQYMKGH